MTHEENNIFSETAKIVLFIHPATHFTIDQSITNDATYIKLAKPEWNESGESILYYLNEMRNAAHTDKKYLIMEYKLVIGETLRAGYVDCLLNELKHIHMFRVLLVQTNLLLKTSLDLYRLFYSVP